jgi:hypothetical protein
MLEVAKAELDERQTPSGAPPQWGADRRAEIIEGELETNKQEDEAKGRVQRLAKLLSGKDAAADQAVLDKQREQGRQAADEDEAFPPDLDE